MPPISLFYEWLINIMTSKAIDRCLLHFLPLQINNLIIYFISLCTSLAWACNLDPLLNFISFHDAVFSPLPFAINLLANLFFRMLLNIVMSWMKLPLTVFWSVQVMQQLRYNSWSSLNVVGWGWWIKYHIIFFLITEVTSSCYLNQTYCAIFYLIISILFNS